MKAFFKTADRLFSIITDCPAIDEGAMVIMRPIDSMEYRRYELTTETYLGLPVYKESKPSKKWKGNE